MLLVEQAARAPQALPLPAHLLPSTGPRRKSWVRRSQSPGPAQLNWIRVSEEVLSVVVFLKLSSSDFKVENHCPRAKYNSSLPRLHRFFKEISLSFHPRPVKSEPLRVQPLRLHHPTDQHGVLGLLYSYICFQELT